MRTLTLLACVACLVAGCGDDDPSGPSIPNVAGTYQGSYGLTMSSEAGEQSFGPFPATATISQDEADLFVSIVDQLGGSLTFTGTVMDDGTIALDDDPDLSTLEGLFPECSFAAAAATNSASVVGGAFVGTVDVAGASCPWEEADGEALPTAFQFRFEGVLSGERPTPASTNQSRSSSASRNEVLRGGSAGLLVR